MDVKDVCILIPAMPPGAMATEVIIMIITLRLTELNPWGDENWRNRKCNTEFKLPPSGDSDSLLVMPKGLAMCYGVFFLSVIVFAVC